MELSTPIDSGEAAIHPPDFEKWYNRALSTNSVIVESFFDQIYEDFEPFRGLKPARIRGALKDWTWTLRISNGKVKDIPQGRFRSRTWGDMINLVAADLPDMNVAINPLDEPRIFVPFARINNATRAASEQLKRTTSLPVTEMKNTPTKWTASTSAAIEHEWIKKRKLWPYIWTGFGLGLKSHCPLLERLRAKVHAVDIFLKELRIGSLELNHYGHVGLVSEKCGKKFGAAGDDAGVHGEAFGV